MGGNYARWVQVKVQKKHLGAKPEPKKPGRKKKGQDEEAAEDDEGVSRRCPPACSSSLVADTDIRLKRMVM